MPKYDVTFISRVTVTVDAKKKEDAAALAEKAWNKAPEMYKHNSDHQIRIKRARNSEEVIN